jgi:hypothetical protein
MILYTEKQLNNSFKKYNKKRLKSGMPMITLDKYRPLFERNMEKEWL